MKRRLVTGGLRPLHFKAYTTEEAYGLPALYDQHINKKETCGLPHIIIKNEGGLRPPVQRRPATGGLRSPHF